MLLVAPQAKYHFGDDEAKLPEYAWFAKNSKQTTHPVRELKPLIVDGERIYDLYGNVSEWVEDWHGDYPPSKQKDYKGPDTGYGHAIRGGCWNSFPGTCRSSYRYPWRPGYRDHSVGFRVVRRRLKSSP